MKAFAREPEPEERLLIEAAQSEPARFADLYEQNFARIYAFFARRVATREEAQDLTAEVFHQALASLSTFKWQGAPFVAWLYGIAANVLSSHWQKLGRNSVAEETDLGGAGDEIERSVILAELVELLPLDQRRVVVQRFVKQKSILEIAQDLGRSEGAVKQLQLRAAGKATRENGKAVMNQENVADELDLRIGQLMVDLRPDHDYLLSPLLEVATDLRLLPDSEFHKRLKADLMEEAEFMQSPDGGLRPVAGGTLNAEFLPTLSRSAFVFLPPDHRNFLISFTSHAALVALIVSGIWVGHNPIVKTTQLLTAKLTYLGSGGGGDRSPIPASKGTPPKFSDQQFAPPVIVVRNPNPALPVDSSLLGPPSIKLPQSNQIGDFMSSNVTMPSNGTGSRGGAGSGSESGLGSGIGPGAGPGSDRGFGGGPFAPGHGVTAPRAIYDPDPDYSEEARKAKFQGNVILTLIVDQQGRARDIHVSRSLGMGLDEKAMEAVRKWKFTPGMKDGVPVAVQVSIEVNFRLY